MSEEWVKNAKGLWVPPDAPPAVVPATFEVKVVGFKPPEKTAKSRPEKTR